MDLKENNKNNTGKKVFFAEAYPELAKQWHPTKNGDLRLADMTVGSSRKVWWLEPYDDPKTGKHFDFEWQAMIMNRVKGCGNPYRSGHAVWKGYNDLCTTVPELAKQWHPTKNGDLRPENVSAGSCQKIWWLEPYDDPKTGKHFDFEWQASVVSRVKGCGNPYHSGHVIMIGYNDLCTTAPELAKQWHPTKNGDLRPENVTMWSNTKVWWLEPYDDPKTGRHFDFEWRETVSGRSTGNGNPYRSGRAVWKGYNDLCTTAPELAKQWHPTKNGDLRPENVSAGSAKKVWWLDSYDDPKTGKHFDFEWQATIVSRSFGNGNPYRSGRAVWKGYNDLCTTAPELAKQWHPTKNGSLRPEDVMDGSKKKVWWLDSYDDPKTGRHFDFEWRARVNDRVGGNGNPFLHNRMACKGFNDLCTTAPELAKQWHPTKNGNLKPEDVTVGSTKRVWWLDSYDDPKTGEHFDFEWQSMISSRLGGCGNPFIVESSGETHVRKWLTKNDLAYTYEKKFHDLKGIGGGLLSYDFAVLHSKYNFVLIEYHGLQHFKSISHFGGKEKFAKQKEHDRRKRAYAKKHGYKLIEISYKYETYEQVAAYLNEHLLPLFSSSDADATSA